MRQLRKRTKRGGFNHHARPNFYQHIMPRFAGQPINYLEVGVFYGKSALWMLRNVLTHPESHADLVDPWYGDGLWYGIHNRTHNTQERMDAVYTTACHNIRRHRHRCTIHRMTSDEFFQTCNSHYELIYVDGEHTYDAVVKDGKNAMRHIKPEGVIIFDDVELGTPESPGVAQAVDQWCETYTSQWQPLYITPRQRAYIITQPEEE